MNPQGHDPYGKNPHEAGAKLDAGKVRPALILSGMPRALMAVAEVGTYGARKYTANGWKDVPDGVTRYTDAMDRHRLAEGIGMVDAESGLLHAAHLAWNALARLELLIVATDVSEPVIEQWIENVEGRRPLCNDETLVEVEFRNGIKGTRLVGGVRWSLAQSGNVGALGKPDPQFDVVRFRFVK